MSDLPFPVSDSTTSFWRSENLHALDNYRSTETLPADADIVVIGAGYSGASVVHHLLENEAFTQDNRSIVILEAREACSGATGRNGGHCLPDPYTRAAKALGLIGKEAADEVASFEFRHLKAIGDLVKRDKVDCDFVLTRATDVCLYEEGASEQKQKLEKVTKAGIVGMDDVFFSDERTAERVSGIKGAKACATFTAGHLYPYKLVMHLLEQAVKKGVNLQTNTPVESTPRGDILCSRVVYATNGYTNALVPELRNKLVPIRGICSRIVTPKPPPFLPTSSVLRFTDYQYDYLIPRPSDGSIIVGGARRDYYTEFNTWFNVWDDSKLIEPAKKYFDGYMQRTFIGWEDSGAYTDKVWTGIMGYTDDGFPYVGNVPGKNGQFVIAGFSGHGMPQVFLSAKAIASMIAEGTKLEDTDLPQLYHFTEERFVSKKEHTSVTAFNTVMERLGLKN